MGETGYSEPAEDQIVIPLCDECGDLMPQCTCVNETDVAERLEAKIERIKRSGEIRCPRCNDLYRDEDCECVSYWGEERIEVTCGECGLDYKVTEIVSRRYTTSYEGKRDG